MCLPSWKRVMRVRFLDQAKADLIAHNAHYREVGGVVLANRMLARIKAPVLALCNHPESAPLYELAPGVRRLVVAGGAFLVFYRVRVDVEVLHIRRAEREPAHAELGELKDTTPAPGEPVSVGAIIIGGQTSKEMIEDGRM